MTMNSGVWQASELKELHDLTDEDLIMIRALGKIVMPRMDDYIFHFYKWATSQPDLAAMFSDQDHLERVQRLQTGYWGTFFDAKIDDEYVSKRRTLGEVHARIGLPLDSYFAGMNKSMIILLERLYDNSLEPADYSKTILAFTKLLHLDTTIVVATFSEFTNAQIAAQSQSLVAMSTPVTAIWSDILMLPIVGIIDSKRAKDITSAILRRIGESRSKILIMDISGVAVIDTQVANHLVKITRATKLMGCECLVSGLSPAIAETIVDLGIDTSGIRTSATLRDALEAAFLTVGIQVGYAPAGS